MIRALFDPATALDGPEAMIAIGARLTNVAVHENRVPHFVALLPEVATPVPQRSPARSACRSPMPRW